MSLFNSPYITATELMMLEEFGSASRARAKHKAIREFYEQQYGMANGRRKKKLTIKEYCDYEQVNYVEIYQLLRGTKPPGH